MLHFQSLPLHVLRSLQFSYYRSPSSSFHSQNSHRERSSVYRALFRPSARAASKRAPFQIPQQIPYGERRPFQEPSLWITLRFPCKGALPPGSPRRASTGKEAPFPEPPICPSKSPVKQVLFRFPNGAPMERENRFQSLLLHTSRIPKYTRSPVKTKSHLSLKVLRNAACPPWSPNTGPLRREMLVSSAFFYVSFRVPCKGVFPPGFSRKTSTGTDAPLPKPSFICLSESPVNKPISRFPNEAPKERDVRFQNLFTYLPEPPLKIPLIKQNLSFLSKSLVNEHPPPHSMVPQRDSMEREALFLEPVV